MLGRRAFYLKKNNEGGRIFSNFLSGHPQGLMNLASGFDKIAFEFCPREANVVAHELAKFSVNSNSSFNWCDD
jgi:hypothetical protein